MLDMPKPLEIFVNEAIRVQEEAYTRLKLRYVGKLVYRTRGKFKGRLCKIKGVLFDGGEPMFLAPPIRLKAGNDGDDSELLNCSESRTYLSRCDLSFDKE
jgi:hypothetical protein